MGNDLISRRRFLSLALGITVGGLARNPHRLLAASFPHFFFSQIKYRGGDWDPNPQFAEPVIEELELRTSIHALKERRVITLSDSDLFYSPFLYMAGKYEFDPFTPAGAGDPETIPDLRRVSLCRRYDGG